mmetsp:Transcript_23644/g.36377  ORF Transcript_23644/g.36377 Transcript_23644/m.36377 type:complete len:205 (-) Transcript_23644:960-1574(-)
MTRTNKLGYVRLAEELLEEMIASWERGEDDQGPDTQSFLIVINAVAKSNDQSKAGRAKYLLDKLIGMDKEGCVPNDFVYSAVLNACAFTKGDGKDIARAVDIALCTFAELRGSSCVECNHVIYGTFLRVLRHQLARRDPQKYSLAKKVFSQCCNEGQVGNLVLSQLQHVTSPELYFSLTGKDHNESLTVNDVPKSWSRNVRSGR